MTGLRFQTRQFLLPKSGHEPSECEDVIAINAVDARFAIADGATEAFDARSWAQLLARSWVQVERPALTREAFRAWVAEQGQLLHDSWNGLSLSWYAEEKARAGSFAAFVGMQLELEAGASRWRAIALGDACLIHCRESSVLATLPIEHYQSFNATPALVPSRASMREAVIDRVVVDSGQLEGKDMLLLLSDAVAAWYLMLAELKDETRARFERLLKSGQDEELLRLFEAERLAGRIKDDDIAVILVEIEGE